MDLYKMVLIQRNRYHRYAQEKCNLRAFLLQIRRKVKGYKSINQRAQPMGDAKFVLIRSTSYLLSCWHIFYSSTLFLLNNFFSVRCLHNVNSVYILFTVINFFFTFLFKHLIFLNIFFSVRCLHNVVNCVFNFVNMYFVVKHQIRN